MDNPLDTCSEIALSMGYQPRTVGAIMRVSKGCLNPSLVAEYCEGWRWREDREFPPDKGTEWQERGYNDAIEHFG